MRYIRISFNNIESNNFIIISYIIDFIEFIEFNKKLFNTVFEFRIKKYILIILFITIVFKIVKAFYIRIMFININNDSRIYNIIFIINK